MADLARRCPCRELVVNDLEALERTQRLQELGLAIRSEELAQAARRLREFNARGGNRRMRRAAAKAARRKRR